MQRTERRSDPWHTWRWTNDCNTPKDFLAQHPSNIQTTLCYWMGFAYVNTDVCIWIRGGNYLLMFLKKYAYCAYVNKHIKCTSWYGTTWDVYINHIFFWTQMSTDFLRCWFEQNSQLRWWDPAALLHRPTGAACVSAQRSRRSSFPWSRS